MNPPANATIASMTTTTMTHISICDTAAASMTQTNSKHSADRPSLRSTSSVPMANETKQEDPCTPPTSDSLLSGGVQGDDPDLRGIPRSILQLQQTQPVLNLMTCGDVSHGKSTLLAALSGERTGKHSAEKKGNMTIRLGYTACKIWKCRLCPALACYFATHSDAALTRVVCKHCGARPNASHVRYHEGDSPVILLRHVSFVDVPGHAQLMQTMVSATSVADAAILVVDASKACPGAQTAQHMDAVHLLGLMRAGRLVVAQNKVDLVTRSRACLSFEEIRAYLSTFGDTTLAHGTPLIPISAQSQLNIDALCHAIVHALPKFSDKLAAQHADAAQRSQLCANVIRSFDVNKARDLRTPSDIDAIAGGVLGGAVLSGRLAVGQQIEIRPGYIRRRRRSEDPAQRRRIAKLPAALRKMEPRWEAQPIRTTVRALRYGRRSASVAFAGGNVGVQTDVDPSLTKADGLCGHVIVDATHPRPPPIFDKFAMSLAFLAPQKPFRCDRTQFETIRVNIGAFKMRAEVVQRDVGDFGGIVCVLEAPICARVGDAVGVCRQNKRKEWAFVGGGVIRSAKVMRIAYDAERQKALKVHAPAAMTAVTRTSSERRVHVRYQQRSGRKGVTTVEGLPQNLKFKALATRMKREWSTNVAVRRVDPDDRDSDKVIQIQGDRRREVQAFVVAQGLAQKAQVRVHGY